MSSIVTKMAKKKAPMHASIDDVINTIRDGISKDHKDGIKKYEDMMGNKDLHAEWYANIFKPAAD